jgi:hypothetical protein
MEMEEDDTARLTSHVRGVTLGAPHASAPLPIGVAAQ